jgi:hypothetical protein
MPRSVGIADRATRKKAIAEQSGHPSTLRYAETLPDADFCRSVSKY